MKCVARVSDSLVFARFGGEGGKLLQMESRELQNGEEGELTKERQEGEEREVTKVARAPCLEFSSCGPRISAIELSSPTPSPIAAVKIPQETFKGSVELNLLLFEAPVASRVRY